MIAELAVACNNLLGEGPVWHKGRNSFFWVDIEGRLLQEYNIITQNIQNWQMPVRIGTIAIINNEELVIALHGSIVLFNLSSSTFNPIVSLDAENKMNRANDGKCDSKGRLWVGTMHIDGNEAVGSLFVLEGKKITKQLTGLGISNGMDWTADDRRFYFIDSPTQRVDAFNFNASDGTIQFDRTVIQIPVNEGSPDGMCIDNEGMLWVAQWGGYAVKRYNPNTGELLQTIDVPAPQVTSCAFGGENLDTLFITTASVGLSADVMEKYPLSGNCFICRPGVKGVAPFYFKP